MSQATIKPLWLCLKSLISLIIAAFIAFGLFFSTPLHAQGRTILNQSFEDGTGQPGIGSTAIVSDTTIDGWSSSNGDIEIWGDGAVGGTPSSDGDYFVELNPTEPIQLYQDVCLINGEELSWTFDHAARTDGPDPQTVEYEVLSSDGSTLVQLLDTSSISPPDDASSTTWTTVTGTTTYTGTTGQKRITFESTNSGSYGNFLDNVQITLVGLIEFEDTSDTTTASNNTSFDENSSGDLPQLVVSGTVDTDVTVPITITGGTATAGVDFTPSGPESITISAGVYDGTSSDSFFTIPYTIVGDTDVESDETIEFGIGTPSSTAISIGSTICSTTALTVATHTIVNDDSTSISAVDDTPSSIDSTTGSTISNVIENDTLNGVEDPTIGTDVTVNITGTAEDGVTSLGLDTTPADGGITFDASTGELTVEAGTTAGTYVFTYEICDVSDPTICDTATVTIVVVAIDLIDEIEDDLIDILEEDLANTLIMQSGQISSYSADASDRLRSRTANACLADVTAQLSVQNILFDTDKAIIKPESYTTLDDISVILASCPGTAFEIAGHTDSDASDAYNVDLSQRRVDAVQLALTERGVDTTGYVARGYGESQPIASNATEAGKSQNRRVVFLPLDADIYQGSCDDSSSLVRSIDAQTSDDGVVADGQFLRDRHDCITDRREIFEGTLSYIDTDEGQTQSAINLSYRRERYRGSESVFGYFVGLYGSQSDVASTADGEIRGLGLNAGVYGARKLRNTLFLDYYLAAAAGRHEFDLDFDRDYGTISATGEYEYLAGFTGAALSGGVDLGKTTVTPRIGFDYVYTSGADVDVIAELGDLTDSDVLELDAISGGRVFAEVRTDYLIRNGEANIWFNPRVACYQSIGSLDGVCGLGGSVGIESAGEDRALIYAFKIDGERGENYTLGSITVSVARETALGVLSTSAGLESDGTARVGGALEVDF